MYAKPRLPDPVRAAAVRAVLIIALTLVQLTVALLCSYAGVWLAFPMVLATVASTVVATWGVLDVWVTRQMWIQRHGVVSEPSSVARPRRTVLGAAVPRSRTAAGDGAARPERTGGRERRTAARGGGASASTRGGGTSA